MGCGGLLDASDPSKLLTVMPMLTLSPNNSLSAVLCLPPASQTQGSGGVTK